MNEFAQEVWKKHINNWLEQSTKALEKWGEQRAEEEALKLSQQIAECKGEMEKLTTNEIADIIVTATNENKRLEEKNKELLEELKTLEKIKNIIIEKYNLEEDY